MGHPRRQVPPESLNDALLIFAPKGDVSEPFLVKAPADTRPLALTNSDSKLMASVMTSCESDAVTKSTVDCQRGFVRNRNFVNNVVEIETAAVIYDLEQPAARTPATTPCIVTWDFAAAFPSIQHEWIRRTMSVRGFPEEQITFFNAMNYNAHAFTHTNHGSVKLFPITAGVPQGCPASGSKYTIAADPPLRALQEQIGDQGKLAACADDTAAALRSPTVLRPLVGTFTTIHNATGLNLKPQKCNIVPIFGKNPQEPRRFRQWLIREAPDWRNFRIARHATYLGFEIGPGAALKSWTGPVNKWHKRTEQIAATGAGPAAAGILYSTRAATTLSYVAQLLPIPVPALKSEKKYLHRLLHLANNSFPLEAFFHWHFAGGPKVPSIETTTVAARVRFAVEQRHVWHPWLRELQSAIQEFGGGSAL